MTSKRLQHLRGWAFLAIPLVCPVARAQNPDLRGIYVGGNNIVNENAKSLTAALTVPGVDGFLLNIGWDQIEPALGQYDWTTLDQWITKAISAGKKITVSVGDGAHAPSWLFQPAPAGAGATGLSFSISRKGGLSGVCDAETIAAPWDPAFLKQWDSMLAALSAHLKSAGTYNAVTLLRLTGINRDTDELHLPTETPQSAHLACVSDSIATWQQAGYRPSLLLQGWDAITTSFQKNFPDKSFSVAIIARTNTPFPPIAEDGSVMTGDIPDLSGPPLTLASQKFPGHLIIQNNSLYPTVPAQPATIQFAQSLGTMIAFQTNEDLASNTGKTASCGIPLQQTAPCTDASYLTMLEMGIYPLGKGDTLRAQDIEVFATDVISFPDSIQQAHLELTCDYALNLSGQAFTSLGGTGTITITTGVGCPWTVGTLPAGVTLTSAGSGTGNGTVTFRVLSNGTGDQSNSFTVAEQTFTVEQAAASIAGLTPAGSLGQVASEGTWDFSLIGVNLGASAATARFNFADDNGNPLMLPLTFPQLPPAAGPLLASTLDRTLNPNAQIVMESTGPDSATTLVGSGQVQSNGNVSGFGIFSNPKVHWNAVVPLETRNASKYILAFDNTGTLTTGLAIASLAAQVTNVPVIIRDDTGNQIPNTPAISLSALGHDYFMLPDRYPATKLKRGTIEFDTPPGGQISVLGLRANGPALTTLPLLANVGTRGGSITHVAYNGGWTSVFYIVNTGSAPAQFNLSFVDENGVALPVPLLLPQSGANTTTSALTRTLAAGEMLVVDTNRQDSPVPVVGSAQLTATGNVGGFEIFRWNTFNQEASVPLETRTPNSFVLVFDNTNGLTTGVALANLSGSSANITVNLRDDTGAPLPSMPINLPPRGHKSFMLPDPAWYPAAANRRGMAEFVVPQGLQISVIGLRARSSDGTLTTIPVLAK